jgi:hypothetical protein
MNPRLTAGSPLSFTSPQQPFSFSSIEVIMAMAMTLHWPEMTKEQYDQITVETAFMTNPAKGSRFHAAWYDNDGLHVFDIWESPEDFQRFAEEHLGPAAQKIGIQGQPNPQFHELYNVSAPNVEEYHSTVS